MSFYVSTATFFLLHCDEWDRIVALPRHKFVTGATLLQLSNSSHLEWRVEPSDTLLKWDYPRTIPARFSLIWFSGFRGKDLNVIFYQNMPNLHNRYKSAERKISQKNAEYILNYSLPCSCSLSSF